MAIFPVTLTGATLGQRHRSLNTLVHEAFKIGPHFEELQIIQELSPIDRLYKIDLASKLKKVDYIIQNLKDLDMLYVSRALKSKWLLENEHQNIMNPEYLEQHLYPYMITTAVSKMKCWISINLKDPNRCQEFYEFYLKSNFDLAIRFLTHCQVSYILNEMPTILEELKPFYFKVLCEKSPLVAKIFFDSLSANDKVLRMYLEDEKHYYKALNVVLKADSNIYLDITEKYFNRQKFKCLKPSVTKYIINNCKDRFLKKAELYAGWLLNMKTMAKYLTKEECKEVVVKLARAEYLGDAFSFKKVEPLIKRIPLEERSTFEKTIFVDNNIGDKVHEWPYEKPSRPSVVKKSKIFEDNEPKVVMCPDNILERFIGSSFQCSSLREFSYQSRNEMRCSLQIKKEFKKRKLCPRTLLDKLFDDYRFMSFEKTMIELSKKIKSESSPQNRQYMLLVLVSKTGGRTNSLDKLLELLTKHINESSHIRSAIVRSLVKRAFVWRLPQISWESFLKFAVGLGLDGKPPEAECCEGLHAVVLRYLLETSCIPPDILPAFITKFSTLKEYALTVTEQKVISKVLPEFLLSTIINETNTNKKAAVFNLLLQTLDRYKVPIDSDHVVPVLATLVNLDPKVGESLILKLFHAKQLRRELFLENFMFISTDASYLNALRHNTEVLRRDQYIKRTLEKDSRKDQFFRKLAIYFTEDNGLAELYSMAIEQSIITQPHLKLARPFALLAKRNKIDVYIKEIDKNSDRKIKRIAAALQANSHVTRPKFGSDINRWPVLGLKAIANKVICCPSVDTQHYLINLVKSRRTAKLALVLSQRSNSLVDTFSTVSKIRPKATLKCALKYFHRNPNTFNKIIWDIVKPIIETFDFANKSNEYLNENLLWKLGLIPLSIRAEYCFILLAAAKKNSDAKSSFVLSHIQIILNSRNIDDDLIENILTEFLQNEFLVDQLLTLKGHKIRDITLYSRILFKFIMLSKSPEIQMRRIEQFADPFLNTLKYVWDRADDKAVVFKCLKEILNVIHSNAIFFDEDYASCVPIFERLMSWLDMTLTVEKYFSVYAKINLITLYFKTVKQCLNERPEVFQDEKRKYDEGIYIFGKIYGHYIANEVNDLISKYFESILDLYTKVLTVYLNRLYYVDPSRNQLLNAIMKGLIEFGDDTIDLVVVNMLQNVHMGCQKDANEIKDLLEKKNNETILYFLKAFSS